MLDDATISARRTLWRALSELWLDTELDDADLERIASVMDASGLSLEELRSVYLHEVAPVVHHNLLSVAGVSDGFDESWLAERIVANLREAPRRIRFMAWFPPTRRRMTYATERPWAALCKRVLEKRADSR